MKGGLDVDSEGVWGRVPGDELVHVVHGDDVIPSPYLTIKQSVQWYQALAIAVATICYYQPLIKYSMGVLGN